MIAENCLINRIDTVSELLERILEQVVPGQEAGTDSSDKGLPDLPPREQDLSFLRHSPLRAEDLPTVVDSSVKTGRPQSIPAWFWPEVFRLYGQGLGYRAVADALISLKVSTTKSSVERLIKGLPPYQGRRPAA